MLRLFSSLLLSLLIFLTAVGPSWAELSYVGGQCGSFVGTTSPQSINYALTGGTDAAPITDDLVLAAYNVAAAGDPTLIIDNPGGTDFALQGTEIFADGTVEDTNLRVAARVMPDPTETSLTLSTTAGGGGTGDVTRAGAYCFSVWRGAHATFLEQAVQQGTGASTFLVNPGTLTPTTAGTYVVTFGGGASTNTSGNYGSSDLTAFQEGNADDGHAAQIGAGHIAWTSGAVAPATWTNSRSDSTNFSFAWMMLAIKPAVAPAGGTGGNALMMGVD